mmetsp:Transcript_16545/g.38173  ORF Transcript_16545/g.38173 Transcript_16545/m.38173 type:complete len:295 (+) Transcript_16545:197-1081(+)
MEKYCSMQRHMVLRRRRPLHSDFDLVLPRDQACGQDAVHDPCRRLPHQHRHRNDGCPLPDITLRRPRRLRVNVLCGGLGVYAQHVGNILFRRCPGTSLCVRGPWVCASGDGFCHHEQCPLCRGELCATGGCGKSGLLRGFRGYICSRARPRACEIRALLARRRVRWELPACSHLPPHPHVTRLRHRLATPRRPPPGQSEERAGDVWEPPLRVLCGHASLDLFEHGRPHGCFAGCHAAQWHIIHFFNHRHPRAPPGNVRPRPPNPPHRGLGRRGHHRAPRANGDDGGGGHEFRGG